MQFKTGADEHMKRLVSSMEKSWRDLGAFRKTAKKLRDEYAGDLYGERGGSKHAYINKIQQMVGIYSRLIVSGEPKVRVSAPDYPERRPFAEAFTVNLNRRLKEVKLGKVAQDAFIAAMTGVGIVKTGMADGDESFEIDGEFYDPGFPFSELIQLDDFIIDLQASSLEDISYIGDRFRMPRKAVREIFDLKKHEETGSQLRRESDFKPEDRTSGIIEQDEKSLYDEVWVWEVYLPKEGIVVTWPDSQPDLYKWHEWDGPEGGPYDVLDLVRVPGEVLPVPPVSSIYHLHDLINKTMRKLSRQTGRQKVITAYEGDAAEDADAIVKADDGEAIRVNNIDGVKQFAFGGPDPQIHNMVIFGDDKANLMAGNLHALGGLAPQSETFKQDAMLQEQASSVVESFRDKTVSFMESIVYKHAWFMWTEPIRDMRTVKTETFAGIPVDIEYKFTPEEKEGDFLEYNFEIDVYSMRKETPAEKAQKLMAMYQQAIMPSAEMLMQSGYMPNVVETLRKLAEFWDIPFDILLTSSDPEANQHKVPGEVQEPSWMGGMPQQTHRTYERISRPGTTPAGNDKNLMQANLGAKPQNDAAASTFSRAV